MFNMSSVIAGKDMKNMTVLDEMSLEQLCLCIEHCKESEIYLQSAKMPGVVFVFPDGSKLKTSLDNSFKAQN